MTSVSQASETLRQILEAEATTLAKETGFIQRERAFSGADFAQTLILGWLAEPAITLDGLAQVAGRREVEITASGLHQRLTPAAAALRAADAGAPPNRGSSCRAAEPVCSRDRRR